VLSPTHRTDRTAAEEAAQIDLRRYGRDCDTVGLEASSSPDQPTDEDVEVGDGDGFCTLALRERAQVKDESEPRGQPAQSRAGHDFLGPRVAAVEGLGHLRRGVPTPARCRLQGSKYPPRRGSSFPPHSLHRASHCQRPRPFVRGTRPASAGLGEYTKRRQPATDRKLQLRSIHHYLRLSATRRIVDCAWMYSALMILSIHRSLSPPRQAPYTWNGAKWTSAAAPHASAGYVSAFARNQHCRWTSVQPS
jgi:hypothetical protein